jgi:predicted O-methyltransferase YrrM
MASVIESLGANKEVYSIDLFEPINYIPDLNFEAVSENLKKFPFVTIIKGRFPERLYSLDIEKIAFAFIDEYAYPDIMEYIYPRMTRGGIILIDNYNHGCDKNHGIPICNLFFQDKKEKILRVGGSHGLIVKQ